MESGVSTATHNAARKGDPSPHTHDSTPAHAPPKSPTHKAADEGHEEAAAHCQVEHRGQLRPHERREPRRAQVGEQIDIQIGPKGHGATQAEREEDSAAGHDCPEDHGVHALRCVGLQHGHNGVHAVVRHVAGEHHRHHSRQFRGDAHGRVAKGRPIGREGHGKCGAARGGGDCERCCGGCEEGYGNHAGGVEDRQLLHIPGVGGK